VDEASRAPTTGHRGGKSRKRLLPRGPAKASQLEEGRSGRAAHRCQRRPVFLGADSERRPPERRILRRPLGSSGAPVPPPAGPPLRRAGSGTSPDRPILRTPLGSSGATATRSAVSSEQIQERRSPERRILRRPLGLSSASATRSAVSSEQIQERRSPERRRILRRLLGSSAASATRSAVLGADPGAEVPGAPDPAQAAIERRDLDTGPPSPRSSSGAVTPCRVEEAPTATRSTVSRSLRVAPKKPQSRPGPGAAPERRHQILDRTCAFPRTMMSTTARSKKFMVV
jgi:hypothetical protein